MRNGEDFIALHVQPRPHGLGDAFAVVGHCGHEYRDAELQRVETVTGSLLHPGQLLVGRGGHACAHHLAVDAAFLQVVVDVDDVGLARRDAQHLPSPTPQQDRRVRLLHRLRGALEVFDLVVLA